MELSRPMPLGQASAAAPAAQLAKAALRRLALAKLEPTPENYARAYDEELGIAQRPVMPVRALALLQRMAAGLLRDEAARESFAQSFMRARWQQVEQLLDGAATEESGRAEGLAQLLERLLDGVDRGSRQWTRARRKEGVQRVLAGSKADAQRLQQRLSHLVASWDGDGSEGASANDAADDPPELAAPRLSRAAHDTAASDWPKAVATLGSTVACALPPNDARAVALASSLEEVIVRLGGEGATPGLTAALAHDCDEAKRLLRQRHKLLDQLSELCTELTEGLTELAEDDSWAKGQCAAMRVRLAEDPSARGVRSAGELLRSTRERQRQLRVERARARDALKTHIHQMLHELGELGSQTGRFHESVARHAGVIERADSLESLAGAVREMVEESRTVHQLVSQTQERLQAERERASELTQRVQSLEDELRHLSDEVSTDPLTQVANRRGLMHAFEAERSRTQRSGAPLAIALLDVDNFKKLNDRLGHGAGDQALKSLAERVKQQLRPMDHVARYGGEEFVVMLPESSLEQGLDVLSRMQRALTASLFMHEGDQVFVTFSAGLTLYRDGESIESALERADEALYEAKRTGKNRTCAA